MQERRHSSALTSNYVFLALTHWYIRVGVGGGGGVRKQCSYVAEIQRHWIFDIDVCHI